METDKSGGVTKSSDKLLRYVSHFSGHGGMLDKSESAHLTIGAAFFTLGIDLYNHRWVVGIMRGKILVLQYPVVLLEPNGVGRPGIVIEQGSTSVHRRETEGDKVTR